MPRSAKVESSGHNPKALNYRSAHGAADGRSRNEHASSHISHNPWNPVLGCAL
jgi:hypothetical protein